MIDIEKAKKEFISYTEKFDLEKEEIKRKQEHSLRVMEASRKIANKLGLSEEQIWLASIIGLLHDIGRFEQYNRNNTYLNEMLLDHSNLGTKVLLENDYIKKYIDNEKYIPIVLVAIKNHNKFKIEDNLSKEELLFCKIIRDADKLDILYEGENIYWNTQREKANVENSKISIKIEQQFKVERQVKKLGNERNDTIDGLLILLSYIYDINFKETLEIVQKEDYANKILDRFNFKDVETKEKIENLRRILLKFIRLSLRKKVVEG